MKDTELQHRLFELGMGHELSQRVAADIRDRLHPASVVAVHHLNGLCELQGLAGLDGNILKSIGHGIKNLVVNSVKGGKKISKVASYIPGPIGAAAGAANVATSVAVGQIKVQANKKTLAKAAAGDVKAIAKVQKAQDKATAKAIKAQAKVDKKEAKLVAKADSAGYVLTPSGDVKADKKAVKEIKKESKLVAKATKKGFTFDTSGDAKSDKANFKAAKKAAKQGLPAMLSSSSSTSAQLAAGGTVAVSPDTIADAAKLANALPAGSDVSDAMAAALQSGGMNFSSGPAQSLLDDVAAEGVEQTPGGPGSLPTWALPAAAGVAALGLLYMMSKKRGRRG